MTDNGGVVAVRLEGGLGDHLLGMRVLRYIRRSYPEFRVIAYSDAGGYGAQMEICRMSPFVSEVVPVYKESIRLKGQDFGSLNNLQTKYLEQMLAADVFFDCAVSTLHLEAARQLGVSHFEILASRPDLAIPAKARDQVNDLLSSLPGDRIVVMNLAKFGPQILYSSIEMFHGFLDELLKDPRTIVLNVFTSHHDFPHWPEPERTRRRDSAFREAQILQQISESYPGRVLSVVDQPLAVIAALLLRCQYYVGVDNGIKHLAWALDVPRTCIMIAPPDRGFILQWLPDYHRVLMLTGPQDVAKLIAEVRAATARGTPECVYRGECRL